MPNIKSAKKRVLVTQAKTLRNKMIKSQLKTAIKKFDLAVESGNKEEVKRNNKRLTSLCYHNRLFETRFRSHH